MNIVEEIVGTSLHPPPDVAVKAVCNAFNTSSVYAQLKPGSGEADLHDNFRKTNYDFHVEFHAPKDDPYIDPAFSRPQYSLTSAFYAEVEDIMRSKFPRYGLEWSSDHKGSGWIIYKGYPKS
jgi:hypothetical protein